MFKIALFGAGKIGESITALLTSSGRYSVLVADIDLARAEQIALPFGQKAALLNLKDPGSTAAILQGCDAVLSALPFYCNTAVATAAKAAGVHYFDLTEDVQITKSVVELAQDAKTVLMPQCGLAPGFISIAAMHLVKFFDKVDTVKMRVGALPIYPSNRLKYNLTWSTEGLINEYCEMCEVIEKGKKVMVLPLEGYERFSLDGAEYEAFNTSGGLGTLADTLQGKVKSLNYKSVRYPGHHDLAAFLLEDLKFAEDRESLRTVFERSISTTAQDKCLIFVEVNGMIGRKRVQKTYASTVYNGKILNKHLGAIQLTTAAGICAPLDLVLTNQVEKKSGLMRAEDISLTTFLNNEFGKIYYDAKALQGIDAA